MASAGGPGGGAGAGDGESSSGNWRSEISTALRARVVGELVKLQLNLKLAKEITEMRNIAVQCEANIYRNATSKNEYFICVQRKLMLRRMGLQPLPGSKPLLPVAGSVGSLPVCQVPQHTQAGISIQEFGPKITSNVQVPSNCNLAANTPFDTSLGGQVGYAKHTSSQQNLLSVKESSGKLVKSSTGWTHHVNKQQSVSINVMHCRQATKQSSQDLNNSTKRPSLALQQEQEQYLLERNMQQQMTPKQLDVNINVSIDQNRTCAIQNLEKKDVIQGTTLDYDWREEIFRKILELKVKYCSDCQEFGHFLSSKIKECEHRIPSAEQSSQLTKLNHLHNMVKYCISVLSLSKNGIKAALKEKLPSIQKRIMSLVEYFKSHKNMNHHQQSAVLPLNTSSAKQLEMNELRTQQIQIFNKVELQVQGPKRHASPQHLEELGSPLISQAPDLLMHGKLTEVPKRSETAKSNTMLPCQQNSANRPQDKLYKTFPTQEIKDLPKHGLPQATSRPVSCLTVPPVNCTSSKGCDKIADESSPHSSAQSQKLINAILSLPPAKLSSAVDSVSAVVGLTDWQAINPMEGQNSNNSAGILPTSKKLKRFHDIQGAPNPKVGCLLEEIMDVNMQLFDTVVSICDNSSEDSIAYLLRKEGTVIQFSCHSVSIKPQSLAPPLQGAIGSLKLLIAEDYPKSSPQILDCQEQPSSPDGTENLSSEVRQLFSVAVRGLEQPCSVKEMARAWDSCVRRAVTGFAIRSGGGGTFTSTFGAWQSFVNT